MVIGAITQSQKLIDHALEREQKGGRVNMCNALEELESTAIQKGLEKGLKKGIEEGLVKGIQATIRTCKNFNIAKDDAAKNLKKEFSLSDAEVEKYMQMYW